MIPLIHRRCLCHSSSILIGWVWTPNFGMLLTGNAISDSEFFKKAVFVERRFLLIQPVFDQIHWTQVLIIDSSSSGGLIAIPTLLAIGFIICHSWFRSSDPPGNLPTVPPEVREKIRQSGRSADAYSFWDVASSVLWMSRSIPSIKYLELNWRFWRSDPSDFVGHSKSVAG